MSLGVSRQDAVKRVRLRMREIAREDEYWVHRRWKALAQIEDDLAEMSIEHLSMSLNGKRLQPDDKKRD